MALWDYCASVNIIQNKAAAKSNLRQQVKSSKGAELQQRTCALKMKVELAKIVVQIKFMNFPQERKPLIVLSMAII